MAGPKGVGISSGSMVVVFDSVEAASFEKGFDLAYRSMITRKNATIIIGNATTAYRNFSMVCCRLSIDILLYNNIMKIGSEILKHGNCAERGKNEVD
ncbi:hypothetical protein [Acetivibrio ethanolgignens]|nr:hypothetical protein [Acetivibrio ethanolgignens]